MKNSRISDCHDLVGCVFELNFSYINMRKMKLRNIMKKAIDRKEGRIYVFLVDYLNELFAKSKF